MIYNELLQSATHSSDYTLSSKCNLSHTQNVHGDLSSPKWHRCLKKAIPNGTLNRGETRTALLPTVSQELSLTWDSISTHSSTAGPAGHQGATRGIVSISWSLTHSVFSFPVQMGQNRGEKKKYEQKETKQREEKRGAGRKARGKRWEEQSDLPYQRHFVRDVFLPAPLFQGTNWGKSCSTTRNHNTSPHLSQHLPPLHASGQKLEMMILQPASSLTVFL